MVVTAKLCDFESTLFVLSLSALIMIIHFQLDLIIVTTHVIFSDVPIIFKLK